MNEYIIQWDFARYRANNPVKEIEQNKKWSKLTFIAETPEQAKEESNFGAPFYLIAIPKEMFTDPITSFYHKYSKLQY